MKLSIKVLAIILFLCGNLMSQEIIPIEYRHEYICVTDAGSLKKEFKYGEFVIRLNEKAVELLQMEPIGVKEVKSLDHDSIYIILKDDTFIVLKKVGELQMTIGWKSALDTKLVVKTLCNWK